VAASVCLPWARYIEARLPMVVSVSGWSSPKICLPFAQHLLADRSGAHRHPEITAILILGAYAPRLLGSKLHR